MSSSAALLCTTRAGHYAVSAEHTYCSSSSTVGIAVADEASDAFALGGTEGGIIYQQQSLVYLTMISAYRSVMLSQANRNRLRALLLLRILPFP